ncbi:MAG: MBL fold metallo-hydrolase [Planctomycetota bacterium]
MQLSFFGAAGEVTGSCYLLETDRARIVVDFGMHQGGRDEWRRNLTFPPLRPESLNAVLVTHAHIDHIGRLPLLPKHGYTGPIYATEATRDFIPIMLNDSGRLQESDAARTNFRFAREGRPPIEPLYTEADAQLVPPLVKSVKQGNSVEVAPGIRARWFDAGHMLGSASIEVTVQEKGVTKVIVFSGDIGHKGTAILRDPEPPPAADIVILESTYGDRDHRPMPQTIEEFTGIIMKAVWDKERVLVPAFAVGRCQQLVYHLAELRRSNRVPAFPVFVDSPMAALAFEVYRKHVELYDAEAVALLDSGGTPLSMPDLKVISAAEDSKKLNSNFGCNIIVAPSGMCTGGRILHHLRHNVWRKGVHILIVGYQSHGSIGRQLVEGAETIRIMGDTVVVRAQVHTLNGFSGHAGQTELLSWATAVKGASPAKTPPKFILTHGEDMPRETLANKLTGIFGATPNRPKWGDSIDLNTL